MSEIINCPVCSHLLIKEQNTYKCENNHTFDLAKEGYLNLLLNAKKTSGDSKEMMALLVNKKVLTFLTLKFLSQLLLNVMMRISVSDFHNLVESTLSLSHSYVLQMTLKKYVVFVKKLEIHTYNFWLKLKTNKVSKTLMKSSKQLMVS